MDQYRKDLGDGRVWQLMARVGNRQKPLWVDVLPATMSQFDLRYGTRATGSLEAWVNEDPSRRDAFPMIEEAEDAERYPEIFMKLGGDEVFPRFPAIRELADGRHKFDRFTDDHRPLRLVRTASLLSFQALGRHSPEFEDFAEKFPFLVDVSWNDVGMDKIAGTEGPLRTWLQRPAGVRDTPLKMIDKDDWYHAAEGIGFYEVEFKFGKFILIDLDDAREKLRTRFAADAELDDERVSFVRYDPKPKRAKMDLLVEELNNQLGNITELKEVLEVMAGLDFLRYSISGCGVLGQTGLLYEWLRPRNNAYEQAGSPPADIVCPRRGEVYRANSFAYDMLFGVRYCAVVDDDNEPDPHTSEGATR